MSTAPTSLLQTALQNLHVSQQARDQSHTPLADDASEATASSSRNVSPPESGTDDDLDDGDDYIAVGRGTRPGTPSVSQRGFKSKKKDPLRTLPTHLAVRVFLELDVKALARCDAVCKRWHKSSTLNYVWFLQNRALTLPSLNSISGPGGKLKQAVDDTPEYFDPYDKTPRLAALPKPPLPQSNTPQWTKNESKKVWKTAFHLTLKRSDPNAELEDDPLHVDISSLHTSGTNTPSRHSHAGQGSGGAAKWVSMASNGPMSPSERKLAARENYKALGGRKSRAKRKMGGEMGARDKGGAVDDGRFDAPW
ncbi:hypothetical protein BD324DRAFT_582961 [Kockovaella imperatae]|uniref:F-box domain-containing protein n=1 Tax=Kockovaella imperatae TaxID=4999 RepID=A0A1Y1U9N4_9TREE|nr:hypothetical protein BD324DRAFT_582961 [Kockovaella imperatae]ORX34743.1 hypothetical protein BD324DRAFT_582961 [Kockovaella imperatae]